MDIVNISENLFLFSSIPREALPNLLSDISYEICKYDRHEIIYSPKEFEKKIGFVLKGRCEVRRMKHDAAPLTLNIIDKYDSFGVLAAFTSDQEFPTVVYSLKETEILFFSKVEIVRLMERSSAVSLNIINFLANKISFLNNKIATFTCVKAEDKLASFILSEYERYGSHEFPFNCKKTAEVINVGRASIYRALEHLCACGYISYDTKKISIINLSMLKGSLL